MFEREARDLYFVIYVRVFSSSDFGNYDSIDILVI